jgi:hypothetical protein
MKTETSPPQLTLYFDDIDLKNDAKTQLTGVYFPEKFQPGKQISVLLYLFGHDNPSIDKHWVSHAAKKKDADVYLLREELNASKKNLVLVAPTLGPTSAAGLLVTSGVNWYLGTVLDRLKANAPAELKIDDSTSIKDVYVMAHSGGGVPMLGLANKVPADNSGNLIRQFWGYDCLYAPQGHHAVAYTNFGRLDPFDPEHQWLTWAFGHQGIPFFMHWATDEPTTRALNLQKMAVDGWRPSPKSQQSVNLPPPAKLLNVTVIESAVKEHEPMVRPAMKIRLDALP